MPIRTANSVQFRKVDIVKTPRFRVERRDIQEPMGVPAAMPKLPALFMPACIRLRSPWLNEELRKGGNTG